MSVLQDLHISLERGGGYVHLWNGEKTEMVLSPINTRLRISEYDIQWSMVEGGKLEGDSDSKLEGDSGSKLEGDAGNLKSKLEQLFQVSKGGVNLSSSLP